jgi:hypothetical protein
MKRSRETIIRMNKEGGFNFFDDELKKFRSPRWKVFYDHYIKQNYVIIKHYHGIAWYKFNEQTGEITWIKTRGGK